MDPQLTGISSHRQTKGLSAHFKDGEQLMSSKLSGQVRVRVQSADPDLTMQAGCCGDGVSLLNTAARCGENMAAPMCPVPGHLFTLGR